MTRRPIFWLTFTALGLAGAVTAVTLFSSALPSISVDIDMNRGAAIDSAAALADRYAWGAPGDRAAATFGLADDLVQTYVELEGGGREVIEGLADRNVYEAYQWRVRRFAEGRVEESWVRFTPAGEPYGFELQLSEDDPGAGDQTAGEAQALAEATALEWGIDLGFYEMIESSSETLPAGRVDHSFVYERSGEELGEARFRLRLGVAGQRPSELTHFVSVPEAFSRRYADMRSTNETIALVAQAVLLVVFVIFGAGVGSALLLRARWLEWRAPLAWGAVIACFFGAATVNQLPLTWTAYDTALSATSFVLQQLAGGAAIAILGTPLIAFFLLAGESLGRKAFPGHVQQWRFWSPEVASSTSALGLTVAAYLMVGLQVGYVVLFYLGTQNLEGWWSPANALVQPDLLATYLPWLEAVSLALFASLWEESLFRAVPIACAALLGARFGGRRLWIWGAVLLQALVFAAGHANYPQQPPYARVIELMAPALLWGAVYVRFGLVPTILAHFIYDLSLISIVLFESEALLDQVVIFAVGLLPLGIVVGARVRHGGRPVPPDWAYNGAWTPAPPRAVAAGPEPDRSESPSSRAPATGTGPSAVRRAREVEKGTAGGSGGLVRRLPGWSTGAAALVGLAALALALAQTTVPSRLWGSRAAALEAVTRELGARGVAVEDWDLHVTTTSGATQGRRYVFQEAGPEAFASLEGEYFGVARWMVRLVDWDADPAERVEEYRAWVGPGGQVRRVSHALPEGRPGASLEVDAARSLALTAVEDVYQLEEGGLREVEAQETSRPSRTDWLFTFTEIDRLPEVEGEARLQVQIAGDEVVDVVPTIYIPEEWQRERRRIESRNQIMAGGLGLLLLLMFGGCAVTAVVVWSRGRLPLNAFAKLASAASVALIASSVNDWPITAAAFSTGQPWSFQANATLIGLALVACIAGPAIGLVGALGHAWLGEPDGSPRWAGASLAFGVLFGGVSVLASTLAPGPYSRSYLGAASWAPLLAPGLNALPAFFLLTSAALCLVALRSRFGHHGIVASLIWSTVLAVAVVLVPPELQVSAPTWVIVAGLAALVIAGGVHLCSLEPALIPGLVGTVLAVRSLGGAWWEPYAGARLGSVIAVAILGLLAWYWMRELTKAGHGVGVPVQSLAETRTSVGSE